MIIHKIQNNSLLCGIRKMMVSFFSRSLIVFIVIVLLSNFIVNYPKLAHQSKINYINFIMPHSFAKFINISTQAVSEDKLSLGPYIRFYKTFIRLFPKRADAYGLLGYCLLKLGKDEEAMAVLKKAVKRQPDYFWFHYNLGLIYFRKSDLKKAESCFEKALDTNFQKTLKYMTGEGILLKMILLEDHSFQKATTTRLKQGYKDCYKLLASCYYQLKEYDQLEQLAQRKEPFLNDQKDFVLNYLGIAAFKQGKFRKSYNVLKQSIELKTKYADGYYYYSLVLEKFGHHDAKQKYYSIAENYFRKGKTLLSIEQQIVPLVL